MWSPFLIALSLFLGFGASWIGTRRYLTLSVKRNIVARPNERTLHDSAVPSGGGVVFAVVFLVFVVVLALLKLISAPLLMALGVGGAVAALFGLFDDIADSGVYLKLIVQVALAVWAINWLGRGSLGDVEWIPNWLSLSMSCFLLVWMMNLYNFMDGVDGMAASGAVFVASSLVVALAAGGQWSIAMLILMMLASVCAGFLAHNWPPASIFMGDSGSMFLGYTFGALVIDTTTTGEISVWTWIAALGYFLGETTTTILLRVFRVRRWYQAHRSHAYQNLARELKSHAKVTGGVQVFQWVYLFPLVIWSVLAPDWGLMASLVGVGPSVFLVLKFGPLYSSA